MLVVATLFGGEGGICLHADEGEICWGAYEGTEAACRQAKTSFLPEGERLAVVVIESHFSDLIIDSETSCGVGGLAQETSAKTFVEGANALSSYKIGSNADLQVKNTTEIVKPESKRCDKGVKSENGGVQGKMCIVQQSIIIQNRRALDLQDFLCLQVEYGLLPYQQAEQCTWKSFLKDRHWHMVLLLPTRGSKASSARSFLYFCTTMLEQISINKLSSVSHVEQSKGLIDLARRHHSSSSFFDSLIIKKQKNTTTPRRPLVISFINQGIDW